MNSPKIPNKILLLNKEAGETSFQSLGKVKKLLGTRKVGHTGTLDKFARGLMIVLSGKLTRLNPVFTGMDKRYQAEICFGKETDTLDPEGSVIARAHIPAFEEIEKCLFRFLGLQDQVPPLFSAIHVDGKRAWKRALGGENIQMKARSVHIYSLEILNWEAPRLTVDVRCSKGTYIRSLARDIGLACGSRAYLTALLRTEVGPYRLDHIYEDAGILVIDAWDLTDSLQEFSRIQVDSSIEKAIGLGKDVPSLNLDLPGNSGAYCGVFNHKKQLLAVIDRTKDTLCYLFVVPPAAVN